MNKNISEFLSMTLQEIIDSLPEKSRPNQYLTTHKGAVSLEAGQGDCGYQFYIFFTAENPEIPERFK